MYPTRQWSFTGTRGPIHAQAWDAEGSLPRYVAVLCHGYGEHIGRYEQVAEDLLAHGAVAYGLDHIGHGRSAGERVHIEDYDDVVADLHTLLAHAAHENPELPLVLIGHSMGGMIAARYAQQHGADLAALVLSGPVLGSWHVLTDLAAVEEIPDTPLDVSTLSRDPEVGQIYSQDPLVWHGPFKRTTVLSMQRAVDAVNAGGGLGDLPTFWVHGEDDQLVPVLPTRTGIEYIRGTRFSEAVLPGARHEVFNETNRAEVLDLVTGFIDEVLTARS